MKRLMLSIAAVICFSFISFGQQDSTTNMNNRNRTTQRDRSSGDMNNGTNNNNNSSRRKTKRTKSDSMNRNMDSTSRMNTR